MKRTFTHTLLLAVASATFSLPTLKAQSAPGSSELSPTLQARAPWAAIGAVAEDVRISSSHTDTRSGLEMIYVQQLHRGIPIYNQDLTLAYANGKLAHKAGQRVAKARLAGLSEVPTIAARAAVLTAVRPWQKQTTGELRVTSELSKGAEARQTFAAPGLARRDIVASLVWALDQRQHLHLAWNVNIDVLGSSDWLNIQVDAATGAIIGQDNWTVHEAPSSLKRSEALSHKAGPYTAARPAALAPTSTTAVTTDARYLVIPYPRENPIGTSFQTEVNPWTKAGVNNNATTHGWHFDGTTTHAITRGNNVTAYTDLGGTNPTSPTTHAPSTAPVPALDFSYVRDFNLSPTATPENRNNAVTNLFYWNNIIHDVMYQYGFTETSGNFQVTNLSRGGAGNDAVRAEALDGSGTNNANMSTPADGSAPRMQMYLWDGPPTTRVNSPSGIAGDYYSVESSFSTANKLTAVGPKTGDLQLYVDAAGTNEACTANTANVLTGKIAVVYRGTCGFTVKVKEAQLRGAIAVLMINNQPGEPIGMGGTDNTITIPAVMVSDVNGAIIRNAMASGPVNVTLLASPPIDGNLDNGVITHEYGHGVSNRLTGGAAASSCLSNAEQGGEGWSDYLGLMLTTDWTKAQLSDGPTRRGVGNYDMGQSADGPGIRSYPYSTSMTINPLTYANVNGTAGVHANGTVWCATLWDMTWNIIQQQGTIEGNLYNSASPAGNNVALQLVMLGMKLQPCQPGFLDARNAILAADESLYGGRYRCAIWSAFARRGMGVSAVQGASTNADDQVAAYDVPSGAQLDKSSQMSGNTFTISLKVTCNCEAPISNYTLSDVLPAGLEYVSSTGGTLSGNTVTFANLSFTAPSQTQTLTIQAKTASGAGCNLTYPVNDDRDANTLGSLTPQAVSGGGPNATTWVAGSTYHYSPTKSWTYVGTDRERDISLTSGTFTPGSASLLSFYHYYNFELGYDGGTVEISTNNGAWEDASPYFLQNGYNSRTIVSPACFSGQSASGSAPSDFIRSTINLSSFSGLPIRIRFRAQTDVGTASPGWAVDDILVTNGCGGAQLVRLYNQANTLVATSRIVTFLAPAPLPVVLLRFDARWQAGGAELTWATASEQNTDRFVVERSLDGSTWADAGTLPAAGNSSRTLEYRSLDAAALAQPTGLLYYRLRQVDLDGTVHYSPVRTVSRPGRTEALVLTALPNPLNGKTLHLNLLASEIQTQAVLTLFDATGRELWHNNVVLAAGTATLAWPQAAELPAGLYLVRAQLPNGRRVTVRVVRE